MTKAITSKTKPGLPMKDSGPLRQLLKRIYKCKELYLLLSPAIIYLVMFNLREIWGMKLAFYDFKLIGENVWAGLKYFEQLFSTPVFAKIIKNTLLISSLKIFLLFPFPVIFAILLNELQIGKFRKSVQVISYLPHFLS